MKRNTLFISILLSALFAVCSCQSSKTDEERALEYRVDSLAHIKADRALQNRRFVIMAERVSIGRAGIMLNNLRRETNFVYVVDNDAVIQLALENGNIGFNGLGGISGL